MKRDLASWGLWSVSIGVLFIIILFLLGLTNNVSTLKQVLFGICLIVIPFGGIVGLVSSIASLIKAEERKRLALTTLILSLIIIGLSIYGGYSLTHVRLI